MTNTSEKSLSDLFLLKIKALYDIETKLVKALPKMAEHASNLALATGFKDHLKETKEHVTRLEKIFHMLDAKPEKTEVEGIQGMIHDADWIIKHVKNKQALDAALIASAQYVEHYEMAGYGTAKEWAELLKLDEAARLLEETLEEEVGADEKLNDL